MSRSKKDLEERIEKTKTVLKEDLNTIRAGRANPALLDKINVMYYGTPTPLKNICNIQVPEARTMLVTPFDPKSLGDVERAISAANIGITPNNDGRMIRLEVPQLTEERRKELTKMTRKMGEEYKVAIRNLRREANDTLKKQQKAGEITEDDLKSDLDDIQKVIDKAIKDIDDMIAAKDKEILEV